MYGYADQLNSIDTEVIEHVLRDRLEAGCLPPSPAGDSIQCVAGPEQNGNVLGRIQTLEEQVAKISTLLDWQVRELQGRAENYKDILIQKLERLLAEERKRSDKLLLQYSQIRDKLNSITK